MKLKKIFEPGKIGGLEIKNRLVVSAMSTHLGNTDGTPTEAVIRYHETKARGGWGLVFTEDLGVTEDAGCDPHVGSLWNDSQIAPWSEFVKRIHAAGGLMGAQIYHAGRERSLKAYDSHPIAPSAVREPAMEYVPREMSMDEIHNMVNAFGECARRVKKCGFKCVEIHGAHGYLVNQFMSTFSNKRNDKYGGTLINRMRFPLEIVAAVRRAVGPNMPIIFRMNTSDYVEGGIELPEAIVMAKMLEEAGVDALHCSQGMYASKEHIIPPGFVPVMHYANNAAAIKASVSIPVIAVGRYNDIYMAEAMLRDGKADFITMARASLADPELPNKAKAGREEEIIHCIGCDQGCTGEAAVGGKINCLVNPHTARETEYDLSPVANPKKVYIAGAGVSGMAAALGAAERGHKVTIFEASNEIGGQWLSAAAPPGKTEYNALIVYYRQCFKKHGVEVRLNSPLTKDVVEADKPDAVILATGSRTMFLPIPGLDNREFVKTAPEILRGKAIPGKNVLVVGGGMTGAETAVFMAVGGSKVTLIEMTPNIITDAVSQPKACLMQHLSKYHVNVHTNTKLTCVGDRVVYAEKHGEPVEFRYIDTVVNAMGVLSYNPLEAELKDCGCKIVVVGDALKTKDGYKNIREGFTVGNGI